MVSVGFVWQQLVTQRSNSLRKMYWFIITEAAYFTDGIWRLVILKALDCIGSLVRLFENHLVWHGDE